MLFAYELFDLWALPRATAWLVLGYFGAALAIDLVFAGATFCKYLCPIGQFNFIASTLSPLELRDATNPRRLSIVPHRRIASKADARRSAPQAARCSAAASSGSSCPLKVGNLDCTFCLDCVHACPHDNIALATRVCLAPSLPTTRRRSGIGRLARAAGHRRPGGGVRRSARC